MDRSLCGTWMPRVRETCARWADHPGDHITKAAVERRKTRDREAQRRRREDPAERERQRIWHREHWAERYERNKDEWLAYGRAYRKDPANREILRGYDLAKRARKLNQSGEKPLPRDLVSALVTRDGTDCQICFEPLADETHIDHVLPLSRGGWHMFWNLRLTHPGCNMRKHDTITDEGLAWLVERGT